MKTLITRIKRLALALCFVTPLVSWAATYSTYKDDATTGTSGAYGNANYQRFKINADWMFNTDDNDIAATADAVKLDSIKVYWHSAGHNNADIGKASGNEVDPYLVVTTPQGVIVGISAAGAKWTASGSSTFEFTDLVISPNAQYYFYFATDVSSLTVGGAMSAPKQARFTGAWHGASSGSATSDKTVCVMDDGRYSIRCDFVVSAATATTITTTSEGVSLSTGSDPVVVKGAVADGVVTVASGATVPTLTVVGEATTLKLTDSLTATYLYLPATTTIDASDVTFTMPGSDETEATTTLVSGKISAASNPSVTLPTPAEGYAFESPAYTDAGIAVTITKFANASLDIGSSTVNWSEVKPEGWVNSPVPTITVAYTDGGKIVFDENVQAASITPDGTGSLVLERAADVTVSIAAVAIDQNAAAMDITFKNFTAIPTYSPYYTAGSDIVRADGTETLTSHPLIHTDNAAGKFYFTQPVTMDAFTLYGNKTVYFNAGTTGSFGRFVLGNTGNKTQTVTQNDGTITVTGNAAPSSNQASILLGHYSGNVTLNTVGGTFNALNAATRLGWDGTATWAIGGGTSAATVNALGIQNGGNGHSGTGTLNIFQNGTLNLGSGGIDFQNGSNGGAINLAGGTIKATADTTIANSKAGGTILNQNKTTTINTDSNTITLSAPLSGAGALTKTGSGVLKVTGAGTATGGVTVSGGTLRFEGSGAKIGTGNINLTGDGAKLELVPGEGNTITLAPQFLINTTGQNSTPVVEVGAGTVVIADTGTSANGHFAYSTINILNGGDMQLTKGDLLGYNFTYPINIAAGGKLTISKRETFTRNLNLNGGSVYLVKNDADDRALDLYNGRGTITVTADSSIDSATDAATIWVRKQAANVTVNSGATLTLNAIVETTVPSADTNGGITKSGDGTLKLTKANTSTGTLAVNAGVLELDGGSWAGPVALAAGTTLNVVTESEIGPGGTIATFGAGSTFGEGVVVQINGETVDDAAIDANGVVTRVVPVTYVAITVPTVPNASVVVSDGTNTYTPATAGGTSYSVPAGSTITVTYTAAEGYGLEGTSTYTLSNVAEGDAVTITDTEAKLYVAQIKTGATTYEKYTTLADALESENAAYGITLLADVTETAVVVDSTVSILGNYTINSNVTIADGGLLQLQATLNGTLTIQGGGTYVTFGGTLGNVVVQDGGIINLTTLSEDAAPLTVSTLTVNGALTIVSSYGLAERGKTYKAISYATGSATIAEGASFNGSGEWSASTVVDGDYTVVCLAITKVAVVDGVYYDTAQEAVEAAVSSGKPAEFLVQPGTVTLGAGETLVVKGGYQPTVALDAGLSTPPYEVKSSYDLETFMYTYAVKSYVAQIGNTKYESLADAVDAATSGATVTLLADVTLDERVDVNPGENTTLTIDLGGYTLTREGTSGNGSVFRVMSGTVTIKNGTVNCTQDDTAIVANGVYAIDVKNAEGTTGAAVVLETLSISVNSQNGACVYPWAGTTATIKSGTYENNTQTVYQYGRFHKAELFGMAVNQANVATQLLFIEGGTFSQINPALGDDSWADGAGTFVAAGYESTEDNGVWVVAALPNYTVTFDADGGTPAPAAQTVQKGSTATVPTAPTKEDYTFAGWTLGGSAYDFATPVTGDITLVASWTAVSSGIDPTDPTSTQDVVVDPTGKTEAEIKEAAIAEAAVTVPAGVSGVDAATYKSYFNYTVTDKGNGVYEVAVDQTKDLKEEVVLPEEVTVGEETISQAEEVLEAVTTDATNATVPAVAGIYYSLVAADNLNFTEAVEGTQTLATGATVTISKPAQLPSGTAVFFRVKASATPNNN